MRTWILAFLLLLLSACGDVADKEPALAAETALLSVLTATDGGQFSATLLEKVSEKRISRTVVEYSFKVSVKNNGSGAAENVNVLLSKTGAGTEILQGSVLIPAIPPGATVSAAELIVLRQDRTLPFKPGELVWQFSEQGAHVLGDLEPAEVYVYPLAELGIPASAESVVATGAVTGALLKDGTLRFATLGDTGSDQLAQFVVKAGAASTTVNARIRSSRPTAIVPVVEPREDGSSVEPPQLTISGLGPNNTISDAALVFKLAVPAGTDLKDDSSAELVAPDNSTISLKRYWSFDAATGSFTIPASAMKELLAVLPAGVVDVTLNFVSKDGEFAANYNLHAMRARAVLKGQFALPDGAAATGLAGRSVSIKGANFGLRKVVQVDAGGHFTFNDVVPDTYFVALVDLENPNVVTGATGVYPASTEVAMTIVYNVGAAPARIQEKGGASVTGFSKQNGAAPERRAGRAGAGTSRGKARRTLGAAATADGQPYLFSAESDELDKVVSTPINVVIPAGTQSVQVVSEVFTEEYPDFSSTDSAYNDYWSYSVTGLPIPVTKNGSVNHSHLTTGSIVTTQCIDVSAQTKNAALTIGGSVAATNVGDPGWPTVTSVKISYPCVGLKVTSAKFLSPNKNGNPVIQPITTAGNLSGPYLSIPLNAPAGTHTIPLEIEFTPPDAVITEVNISVAQEGAELSLGTDNLMSQTNVRTPGKITFSSFTLPTFPGAKGPKKVDVMVRIKGTVKGISATSEPLEGGRVVFGGYSAFTPLFLANDEAALASRRYGTRDTGGDSWTTSQAISWLTSTDYRFDDISAQHVTQTSNGRSSLGHSGHSDGQQFDLRYADGQGGYTDTLGGASDGAGIRRLINEAKAEVAANPKGGAKLDALQKWIAANRAMLDREAGVGHTRVIYIGPSFIKNALQDGKFSAAAKDVIPDVEPWDKPDKIKYDPAHLSHWHLSTAEHP